jgi:hypothetical protein
MPDAERVRRQLQALRTYEKHFSSMAVVVKDIFEEIRDRVADAKAGS